MILRDDWVLLICLLEKHEGLSFFSIQISDALISTWRWILDLYTTSKLSGYINITGQNWIYKPHKNVNSKDNTLWISSLFIL